MVTCPEWISGKGNFIDCMHGGSIARNPLGTSHHRHKSKQHEGGQPIAQH